METTLTLTSSVIANQVASQKYNGRNISRDGVYWENVHSDKFSTIEIPKGTYKVVDTVSYEKHYGSDYCWVTYYTYAIIKSTHGSKRYYSVLVNSGGDSETVENGTLS